MWVSESPHGHYQALANILNLGHPAQLRCRFNTGSVQLRALGRFFQKSRTRGGFQPLFRVQPDYKPQNENPRDALGERDTLLPLSDAGIAEMCEGYFSLSANVALSSSPSTVRISFALQEAAYKSHGSRFLSISGFPRSVETNSTFESRHRGTKHTVYPSAAPPSPDRVERR